MSVDRDYLESVEFLSRRCLLSALRLLLKESRWLPDFDWSVRHRTAFVAPRKIRIEHRNEIDNRQYIDGMLALGVMELVIADSCLSDSGFECIFGLTLAVSFCPVTVSVETCRTFPLDLQYISGN